MTQITTERHDPSGDLYIVERGENGHPLRIYGPVYYRDLIDWQTQGPLRDVLDNQPDQEVLRTDAAWLGAEITHAVVWKKAAP